MTTTKTLTSQSARHMSASHLIATAVAFVLAIAFLLVVVAGSAWAPARAEPSSERAVVGIERAGPIKAVFQITKDETTDGVHKGLFALREMHKSYVAAGIDPKQLDLRAVYHGDAADHLLTDEAWNRWRKETGGNPSRDIIAELAQLGVTVELCDSRRVQNGWSKEDVHPDVVLAANAYQRLIELQLEGYAYIRF